MSINQKLSSFLKTNNSEDSDYVLFSNNSLNNDLSTTVKEDKSKTNLQQPKEKRKLTEKQREQLRDIINYNNKISDTLNF